VIDDINRQPRIY